jgi:serine/threonine protein kinase
MRIPKVSCTGTSSPPNLLRDTTGVIKIADLGLARFAESLTNPGQKISRLTQLGGTLGTASYMSPEQARDLTTIDHRADIYSLGCTLYYLLTGQAPYQGINAIDILLKHREAPIPSLSAVRAEVPPALDAAYQRMVAKQPADRFQSMAEVAHTLESMEARFDDQTKRL